MNGSGGGQNQSDQIVTFFWILVVACVAVMLVWWLRPEWVVIPVFKMHLLELDIVEELQLAWIHIAKWLYIPVSPVSQSIEHMRLVLQVVDPHSITFSEFTKVNHQIGMWVRYPVMVILLILAAIVASRHTSVKFRNLYNMQSLKKAEVVNWPQITPVVDLDLVSQDMEKGPWAMAKTPKHFCEENDLLFVQQKNNHTVYGLKSEQAYHKIGLQVGRPLQNMQALPIHIKALMVIFISRARRDRALANHLLAQISASASSGKLDFSGVAEAFSTITKDNLIPWVTKRHAYVYTVMATLLEVSRADGVLASAEFLWVKPVDRGLWYMLNSVGRQTAVIEAAGPFAHWLAEKKIGYAVKTPMVKEAIKALELSVENILFIDEKEKWQSKEA